MTENYRRGNMLGDGFKKEGEKERICKRLLTPA